MDSDHSRPPPTAGKCPCSCRCCGSGAGVVAPSSPAKRKLVEDARTSGDDRGFARVEIEDEAAALREALASHQVSIQELSCELEEERSAASSAATEAMSMILRLQHEKAETQMEARQYKLFVDEKMAHDQMEIAELEDLIYKRDEEIQSLSCEVQAYQHRLLSFGIVANGEFDGFEPMTPDAGPGPSGNRFDFPGYDYPQLRCRVPGDDAGVDLDKYPFGQTPREQLQHLEQRIYQLERMPSSGRFSNVMEKGVVGSSPRFSRHLRRLSLDSYGAGLEFGREDAFPSVDDVSDRVYTVDAVHRAPENYVSTPREALSKNGVVEQGDENEITKLYKRLQTLEADRESMRQTIISMGTDKAHALLMKEIAQHLCKEGMPENKIVNKCIPPSKKFSLLPLLMCVASFIFWRRKPSPIKYTFGLSSNNVGLLVLLDKSPGLRHRKFLTKSQGH